LENDPLPAVGHVPWAVHLNPPTNEMLAVLFVIVLLLSLLALLNGSETDFFSLSREEQSHLKKNKTNNKILKNLEKPERLLATILLCNTLINVGIVVLSAKFFIQLVNANLPLALELILLISLISLLIFFFGEIIPKLYASRHPMKMATLMASPLLVLEKLFRPFSFLLIRSNALINEKIKKKPQKNISVDEISQALELTSDTDISDEKEILEGIVRFGNKNVSAIMCPRVDVVSIDITSSFTAVLDVINNSGYSRIPVYQESFDQVRGILYIKDLLPYTEKGESFQWQTLLRPPFFVPENKKVKDLLEDFQKNKIHMAIVVDEYGGSSGIVTMEDVLEEIVGDIADEFDEEETNFVILGEKEFLFDGKILLEDFYEVVGCDNDRFSEVKGEADTLAGLILELKGDIPALHEHIDFENFRFTIESVTNRRIRQVKAEIL
jgi:gliding motility-associated protein GldE